MNAAFHETAGDLILILDVDHVPASDIMVRTAGWFVRDPKMFLVQTPHFFINSDPVEKNLDTFHTMPSENEMFYSVIQEGLDFWNSAFFCGSAAVLRRKCLAEVGGIAEVAERLSARVKELSIPSTIPSLRPVFAGVVAYGRIIGFPPLANKINERWPTLYAHG